MKLKTNVKAGTLTNNHNEMSARSLKVKSNLKAGITFPQGDGGARDLKVKTNVRAGFVDGNH